MYGKEKVPSEMKLASAATLERELGSLTAWHSHIFCRHTNLISGGEKFLLQLTRAHDASLRRRSFVPLFSLGDFWGREHERGHSSEVCDPEISLEFVLPLSIGYRPTTRC